jgi:hypothetical protein
MRGALWPRQDRRLLMQMYDIAHRANSVILHHAAASFGRGVTPTNDRYRFDVRSSPEGVSSALRFGFWTMPTRSAWC